MSHTTAGKSGPVPKMANSRKGFFNSRLLEVVLGESQDGVLVVDWLGNIRRTNQSFCHMTGYGPSDLEGRNILRFLRQWQHDADFLEEMLDEIWFSGFWQGEINPHRKDGSPFPARLRVNALLPEQDGERVRYHVGQFTRLAKTRQVSMSSSPPGSGVDKLTGLANRLLFEDRLQQSLTQAKRRNRSVGSMFVDLDRFKLINDSLGHAFGDRLLVEVANRLIHCLRTSDSVARVGADEFGLLLTEIDDGSGAIRNAGVVARKVYEALSVPLSMDGQEVEISAAMGITLFPQDGEDAQEMMKNTFTALAHAKKKGRNSYQFFSAEMTETARRRFDLENRLRHAVDRGEMRLYYQPQVDLKTGKVIGVEALVRWMREGKLISPADFIPIAEESGLIVPIGEWVLKTACQQIAAWRKMGLPPIRVGVNLSAVQFKKQNLAAVVEQMLAEYEIDPSQLDLEITESAIMEDVDRAVKILNRISQMGVKLSIDDFGTGYSSLSQLRLFPFKALKIDRSFVRDISNNPGDAAIVSAIIAMAHSLDQTVIVEGLETADQLTILRNLRCNEMQGFLFSAAIPADDLTDMLIEGRQLPAE
ncbi:MAG: EAL domain-containing protein [Magnetococcales bacterium]|nr:EAL domain-containing protein [Magnetococcales bacterium]MBF0321603.1 EAL domain-containing protein [Magnetococcales bacterium]